jgi:hypothetical protein
MLRLAWTGPTPGNAGGSWAAPAVKDYWLRQWAAIEPSVTPESFSLLADGTVRVRVGQRIGDRKTGEVREGLVAHIFVFEDGLVSRMEAGDQGR